MFRRTLSVLILSLPVKAAADCPAPPDHSEAFDALFAQVQAAPNEMAVRPLVNQMWDLWADAPNAQAQEVLNRGMRKRSAHDLLGALKDFDRLVEYCPDYAEGYNQRGFVRFIQQDYDAALVDLDEARARSPRHTGVLTGRALTLMALGRHGEARAQLLEALELNPWLSERQFLPILETESEETEL